MKRIDFKKYKDKKEPLAILETGEMVVDQEVDEFNNLIYIIRDKDNFRASPAVSERPVRKFYQTSRTTKVVTINLLKE